MSREAYSREEIEWKKREIIESDDDKNCPKPPLPELGEHSNYIFISYPHKDYKQVYCDLWDYYAEGVRYWYDRGLTAGVDWEKEVRQKITDARCSGIVYYLSENSFTDSMAFEIGCAQEVAPDDSHGKSGRNYFSINLGGRQVMDLLFESQKKGLIKTSQDKVAIIFSTFSEKRTFIGRSKDPSDNKHMSAVIEQFRDRFSVVDSVESEVPKRGAAPESETFDIKKRQNGSYAVVALKDKSEMTVFVPEGVEDIGEGAFEGSDVIEVTLPEGLIKIGKRAFADCESLEKINFPSTLRIISDEAFSGCTSLDVDLPENIKVGADAFKGTLWEKEMLRRKYTEGLTFAPDDKEDGYVVSGYEGKSQTVVIPEIYNNLPVVSIGKSTFSGCSRLRSVTIPDSVTSIGTDAFGDTPWEKEEQLKREYTEGLTFALDDKEDGYVVSRYEGKSQTVVIPEIYNNLPVVSIEGRAFSLSKIESVKIPDGVKHICFQAFLLCGELISVAIPKSVTNIEPAPFANCYNLKSITVSNKNIRYHSSENCLIETASKTLIAGCRSSIIPADGSVTSIGNWAFYGCASLESVTIPDGVTSIADEAFYECSSLESITIPCSVTNIGEGVFAECESLESINVSKENREYHSKGNCLIETASKTLIAGCQNSIIPTDGSVTSIGRSAFEGCEWIEKITIPYGVVSIGDNAFLECSSLKDITIPITVTSIGDDAFFGNHDLEKIKYKGTKEMWKNIEKAEEWYSCWNDGCKIQCTDGSIVIE